MTDCTAKVRGHKSVSALIRPEVSQESMHEEAGGFNIYPSYNYSEEQAVTCGCLQLELK